MESTGAKYALPLPLLWQHDRFSPIGHVESAKVTKDGITFRARLAKIAEPGPLKDSIEHAWQAIKAGLVRGVSIGFRAIDYEVLETGGYRFKSWEWLELSPVTIPAHADASIIRIRSIDAEQRAAQGTSLTGSTSHTRPGASGYTTITPARGGTVFDIGQKIKDLEASRAMNLAAMLKIEEKATLEGRTQDETEKQQADEYAANIESIDQNLERTRRTQRLMSTAKTVDATPTVENGANGRSLTTVRLQTRTEPGVGVARVVKALWQSYSRHKDVESVVRQMYPDDHAVQKATIAAASTGGSSWGDELVSDEGGVFADFAAYLRPMTILGKFGTNGIPSLRRVPFRRALLSQTAGGDGYWVGEGLAKPLTKFGYNRTTLEPLKVANIVVSTKELLRDSSPSAETLLRDSLVDALRERLDIDFVDPIKTATPGVSPASITNAATTVTASGSGDFDDIRLDIRSVFQVFIDADNPPTSGVWLMSSGNALALSMVVNDLGLRPPQLEGISMGGGTFFGLPVITSEHIGNIAILLNASDIYLADEGGFSVEMSDQASLEMKDNISGGGAVTLSSVGPTAAALVSMFQTNSVAFLAERTINWAARRDSAVVVLDTIAWGGAVTAPNS